MNKHMKITLKQILIIIAWIAFIFFMKLPLTSLSNALITAVTIGLVSLIGIFLIEKYVK